ncbi:hypothetical protein TNIN_123541 [Trichonephila inaurata madagascariensis]|uniref:Uncharacterized protein n=1 Tax=Trichonephila inaurata madagascariensis TaxID=2747483 RepID=A0A8X7CCQ5_9ARAC|nr:hypothetical protein TNIN_123541 [Trichonephila inaurata madagascariensis]
MRSSMTASRRSSPTSSLLREEMELTLFPRSALINRRFRICVIIPCNDSVIHRKVFTYTNRMASRKGLH